mmetsp:Transcript_31751/g.109171  ORF Transcript_31751/g.109171 Transcript_31751/m.109171 type:complete len:204 (+) Transcript_31751:1088-1699(+)
MKGRPLGPSLWQRPQGRHFGASHESRPTSASAFHRRARIWAGFAGKGDEGFSSCLPLAAFVRLPRSPPTARVAFRLASADGARRRPRHGHVCEAFVGQPLEPGPKRAAPNAHVGIRTRANGSAREMARPASFGPRGCGPTPEGARPRKRGPACDLCAKLHANHVPCETTPCRTRQSARAAPPNSPPARMPIRAAAHLPAHLPE